MKNISHFSEHIKRKVLIVEDEFINQQLLGNIIATAYEPVYANNGKEALEILKSGQHISLILLDLMMPVMDGYQFMNEIKEIPSLSSIPIIVLTSEKSAEIKSLQMGAQDFIVKPYDMPEIILARVARSVQLEEETEMIAKTARDPLTHLFTKSYFFEYIEEFRTANPDVIMDALFIDIKHFSLINEMYGRKVGDELLVALSKSLKGLFNKYEGIVSRIQGDIFYLYISHQKNYEKLLKRIKRETFLPEHHDLHPDFKIGVFPNCHQIESIDDAFDNACRAGKLLRGSYTESIKYYDEEMYQKELYHEKLILDMDKALVEKQFKVYLQPKYDITGDEPVLTSAEALVRWIHPVYGFISPGVFIPLFENNGLIQKLDNYIWNEVAERIGYWKKTFHKHLPVSINVSRIDVLSPGFEDFIEEVVKHNGIETKDLFLEVTESAYASDEKEINDVMIRLQNKGHLIEIDDFGTGYSSLSSLTSLTFDVLKIDMSFIRNMLKSDKNLQVVQIIISIANMFGARTIAEGVETKEQYLKLKELGCHNIQGYYFDKALPMDEFDEKYMK